MAKPNKKQVKQQKDNNKKTDITFSLTLGSTAKKIILAVLLILSVGLPYYYITYSVSVNGYESFPLDDPWIHLQFAKNLADYSSFSYFKNEIVTAGSTSPLYTFFLAAGFMVTKNEMWLSYILGIFFFALSVFYFYRVSGDTFPKENWLAIGAALIFLLDKWLVFISVTGMETTLYIFLLIACFYYYHRRNAVLFAVTLALTFWTRPDAVAFFAAVAADYLYLLYVKKKAPKLNEETNLFGKNELLKIGAIAGGILAVYFIMNLVISGSLLPNTYSAKVKYYSAEFRSRSDFLSLEVWKVFTDSAYLLIFIPLVFAAIRILRDTVKLTYNRNTLALLFVILLIFIYWYKLPYAHRFSRYLLPILPFYILLAVYGGREFFKWMGSSFKESKLVNALNIILILSTIIYFAGQVNKNKELYQDQCRYIYIRQVEAAKWLGANTPEDAIIATHDVGAIAFYSGRKVIDVVGLINPEFIPKLNSEEFVSFVEEQIKKQQVTYLAFLREWFQVVNQPALYSGGDKNLEIMQVFRYYPDKTHILSSEVNSAIMYAGEQLGAKKYQQALNVLQKYAAVDPNSSLTYYLLAYTYTSMGDGASAEKSLLRALEIYPGYKEAAYSLSNLYKAQNRFADAKNSIGKYLEVIPDDTSMIRIFNSYPDSVNFKQELPK